LRRTRVGNFRIEDAVALDTLCRLGQKRVLSESAGGDEEAVSQKWEDKVHSLNRVLDGLPAVWVSGRGCEQMAHGVAVSWEVVTRADPFEKGGLLRLLSSDGELIGLGSATIGHKGAGELKRGPFYKIETMLGQGSERGR
jgi:tRNA U55 pseudouridine synthase TruB